MRTKGILLLGEEVLQQPCQIVTGALVEQYHDDILQLSACLRNFQHEQGFGRAISAPQIGIPLRIISIDLYANPNWMQQICEQNLEWKEWILEQQSQNYLLHIVNPIMTWHSEQTKFVWDDCFSLPDLMVKVQRFASVSIEFETICVKQEKEKQVLQFLPGRKLQLQQCCFSLSELLQHEMDHLEGILMIDRASKGKSIIYRDVYLKRREFFDEQL